jgi:hypothetical protein
MPMMNEGVLHRWARRKRAAKAAPAVVAAESPPVLAPASSPPDLPVPAVPVPELPPIESLGIGSDYTAFLREGVTAELQRLALRRAWESDERIAGFRGMAEYAWDFNAPSYGRLWAADDVAQLLRAVLEPPIEDAPAALGPEPAIAEASDAEEPDSAESTLAVAEGHDAGLPLPFDGDAAPETGGTRRHGSALPC